MKKYVLFAMVVLLVAIFVGACAAPTAAPAPTSAPGPAQPTSAAAPQPPAPSGPKVLRLGRATYPDVLDPQKSSFGIEIEFLRLCYEGLTALDNKGNIGPGSADTFSSAADGKSMTFHIRDGLKRADGSAMNASDFVYALKREVDPRVVGKQYTSNVQDVKGSGPLIDAEGKKLTDADIEKLYADYGVTGDDNTRNVTVTFAGPIGYWKYISYTWVTYPSDKKKVDANPDNWWTKPDGHNCNGPYRVQSIEQGKRIVYVANPNYWRGKPKIDRIEATYVPDEIQRFQAYKNNEFDEIDVTSAYLDQVTADSTLKGEMIRYPSAITNNLAFNNLRKPFGDKNVRIAFSQAFDRKAFIRDVQKGIGVPATRWIPPGVPAYQDETKKPGVPDTDQKAAVDTLIKNGYGTADGKKVDCTKLGDLKITYAATAANNARFQAWAGYFVSTFNCPITLDPVDPTVATALTKDPNTNPQISRQGWIQDYPHPQNWLTIYWTCAAFAKRYGYCNKDLDATLAKADATTNQDDAIKLYQQAEDMLLADIPGAPIYHSENLFLIKPYLSGLKENTSSADDAWAGQLGPVWTYDVDLSKVPSTYPKQ
jgi:oligopeptide transport system substrate-binding protein